VRPRGRLTAAGSICRANLEEPHREAEGICTLPHDVPPPGAAPAAIRALVHRFRALRRVHIEPENRKPDALARRLLEAGE